MRPRASVYHISRLLLKCKKPSQRQHALRLHAYLCRCGIETHLLLGNQLVSVLADVRKIQLARLLLGRLVHRNGRSFNSLILGYIKCGLPSHAIKLYQLMLQEQNFSQTSDYTFVILLKACSNSYDLKACIYIHAEVARLGLFERNLVVGNTLIAAYTGHGLLSRAREIADQLPSRDVVTWNVIMGAYTKLELDEEVLECLDHMLLEGISPDAITFSQCLKACGSLEHKHRGEEIHDLIKRKGILKGDHVVGSCLVAMYCKWGLLTEACLVFDELPCKDVVSWTILIQGYADQGRGEEALQCFEKMQAVGLHPDEFTFACCLKACLSIGAANRGQKLHLQIEKQGLSEKDQVIGNVLVDLYAKCNLLPDAQNIFETLPVRDSVSWNALIAGYGEHGHDEEAIKYFQQMSGEGIFPDAVTYVCLLKSCGRTGDIDQGSHIHAEIERKGLIQNDPAIGNTVVDMYVRCGLLTKAQEVFAKLPFRDIVTWTILLSGYAEHGHTRETWNFFNELELLGLAPDPATFVSPLQEYSKPRPVDSSHSLHSQIDMEEALLKDAAVRNTSIAPHATFGMLAGGKQLRDIIPAQDVTWNTIISRCIQNECSREVLNCS